MLDSSFLFPQYNGRNFANIPATIQYWLTGEGAPALSPDVLGAHTGRYDLVILFFIDSFGWEFIERYADDYAFLKHISHYGRISKITSQFPSTTAAHVTCIHTGLPVGQSGVFEWAYYEPRLDRMITPLLFSYAGMTRRDELKKAGVDPTQLYPSQTIYEPLAARGVKSHTFGSREFTPSTFSSIVMRGAQLHPFWSLSDSMVNIAAQALDTPLPAYIFFYYGTLDAISHSYGPHSMQTHAELDLLLTAMDRWFLRLLRQKFNNALFVMTADHGQAAVLPQNT
ncbi:MAG TPA: alkaline phosphatase family protein, partial [Anaerolineae bacterium]|nr:alkaline phosphatase family protein [Anaerolineae bacterium]